MAVIWPKKLPADVRTASLRRAEVKVYTSLKNNLDDSFTVFYSRPWLGLTDEGEEIDGECDFVIVHPHYGLLAIEVKGGGISYKPELNEWTTTDRFGFEYEIKNPVLQALKSKHHLLKKIGEFSAEFPFIRARHGVIFPDSADPGIDLGADIPHDLICFREQFEEGLAFWIKKRMGFSVPLSSREELGETGVSLFESILARPFCLHVPLSKMLNEDDEEIGVLTQQQYSLLRNLQHTPRILISGAAGTGKTVLAVEETLRSAESGRRVLYLCFNRPLAVSIRKLLAGKENASAYTFHELCQSAAGMAGITFSDNADENILFDQLMPDALVKAAESLPELRYDEIIIDEGQDFRPNWLSALDSLFRLKNSEYFRIFYDSNQKVHRNAGKIPKNVVITDLQLDTNLRNTRKIYEMVDEYYSGIPVVVSGPIGVDVVSQEMNSDNLGENVAQIASFIKKLIRNEGIKSRDVTVIVPSEKEIQALAPQGRLGDLKTRRADEEENDRITLDTIRRFKGLESLVVVVYLTNSVMFREDLLYVAFSRAKTYLVLCGTKAVLSRVKMKSGN